MPRLLIDSGKPTPVVTVHKTWFLVPVEGKHLEPDKYLIQPGVADYIEKLEQQVFDLTDRKLTY
jgi:hypothetical protein